MTRDDDVESDSSWNFAGSWDAGGSRCSDLDARSDASWTMLESRHLGLQARRFEEDCSCNASGAADNQSSERFTTQTSGGHSRPSLNTCQAFHQYPIGVSDVCSHSRPCAQHVGRTFVDLVAAAEWDCALCVLCMSPEPDRLAMQRDSSGDSAISWIAYKSKHNRSLACLELFCRLLMLSPADASKRTSMTFLPLHDAAWGNAPAAIATLLCAAYPASLHDVAQGQTPHGVGHYHHFRSKQLLVSKGQYATQHIPFAWPTPDKMLQDAVELNSQCHWIEDLAKNFSKLRQSTYSKMVQSISAVEWQMDLAVPHSFAILLQDYFNPRPPQAQYVLLPSIPEHTARTQPVSRLARTRRLSRPQLKEGLSDDPFTAYLVDHLRELCPKQCTKYAGVSRVRNTRCALTQLMAVADSAGVIHNLKLHIARTMPRDLQRKPAEAKWPSKANFKRERALQRAQKAHENGHLVF